MHHLKLILTTALLLPSLLALTAADADEVETFHAKARGFGDVRVEARFFGEDDKQSSWTTFHAQDAAHARVVGSKRLADLLGFGDLKLLANAELPGTVLELEQYPMIGRNPVKEGD